MLKKKRTKITMSRSKRKSVDDSERLRNENKELKSMVKSLEREIKKLNKEYKTEYNRQNLLQEEYEERKPKCQECGKGEHKVTELGPRKFITCSVCDYRKVVKK